MYAPPDNNPVDPTLVDNFQNSNDHYILPPDFTQNTDLIAGEGGGISFGGGGTADALAVVAPGEGDPLAVTEGGGTLASSSSSEVEQDESQGNQDQQGEGQGTPTNTPVEEPIGSAPGDQSVPAGGAMSMDSGGSSVLDGGQIPQSLQQGLDSQVQGDLQSAIFGNTDW